MGSPSGPERLERCAGLRQAYHGDGPCKDWGCCEPDDSHCVAPQLICCVVRREPAVELARNLVAVGVR